VWFLAVKVSFSIDSGMGKRWENMLLPCFSCKFCLLPVFRFAPFYNNQNLATGLLQNQVVQCKQGWMNINDIHTVETRGSFLPIRGRLVWSIEEVVWEKPYTRLIHYQEDLHPTTFLCAQGFRCISRSSKTLLQSTFLSQASFSRLCFDLDRKLQVMATCIWA